MLQILQTFRRDNRGGAAIEYAMIGALISIAIMAGLATTGTKLKSMFERVLPGLN